MLLLAMDCVKVYTNARTRQESVDQVAPILLTMQMINATGEFTMLNSITRRLVRLAPIGTAHAHCDIPCGIYNPNDAVQAAQTCIRMTELLSEMGEPTGLAEHNSFARYVAAKEEHATKAKDDILVIWTDYFKPEHLAQYPDLHEKVWNACKLGSQVKQTVDMEAAQAFKAALEEIGEIFWASKQ